MTLANLCRRGFIAAGMFAAFAAFAADDARALDAEAAKKAFMDTPMMKGFKLHEFKTSGKNFTVKLGNRKVPAIVFNSGSEDAPVWNLAIYPKSLKLGSLYKTGAGAALGGIVLSNPAIVLSEKQSTRKFNELPKIVQDGIKKVFGGAAKQVTYPAGVNFSFGLDVAKTPGLNALKSVLGVANSKAAMAGHMGMDLIRYILNGSAKTEPNDLAKVSLTAVLDAIRPPRISRYVNAKNMIVNFSADKDGNIALTGRSSLNVQVDKLKFAFATQMTFEPKAKSAEENLLTMTGTLEKIPDEFGGQKIKSLGLASRIDGARKFHVGFIGEVLLKNKPTTFTAELDFTKLPPSPQLTIEGDLTVADVVGADIPGIGGLAFKKAQFTPDYVAGTIAFRGVETTAVAVRSGNKKPVLALLHKTFDAGAYLPGVAGTPLDQAAIRDVAMIVVPKGSALKAVGAKDLGGPVEEMVTSAIGATARFQLNEGVNLIGAIDVKKSTVLKSLLASAGINRDTLPFAGKVSAEILKKAAEKAKQAGKYKDVFKDKAKEILASLDIGAPIPVPKIPGLSKVLVVSKPSFHIRGAEDEESKEVKLTTVIDGEIALNLPGKTLKSKGGITLLKGTGKAIGLEIDSTSTVDWQKAFGIPFLTLNDMGVTGGIEDDGKGTRSFKLSLRSTTKIGSQTIKGLTNLEIENGAITDISLALPGSIDIGKLPGISKIPGINEFAFKNMTIGLRALSGEMTWKRIGVTSQATLMQVDDNFAAFYRVKDLKLGTLAKGVPEPFASIKFPATALAFSTSTLHELTLADLPDPMQGILDGIVTKPDAMVPVFDGVTLIGALSDKDLPAPLRKLANEIGVFKSLDGPLVLSGGVNGVFSGVPKIGLYASLPGLNLPKKQPLSRVVSFDKGKADFFIRADVASTVFQLGAGGEIQIRVPHLDEPKKVDKLTFRGELYANVDLVSVAGSFKAGGNMKGSWKNPLGLNNFSFIDPAFVVGVDSEGSVEFGIGATAEFAARNNQNLRFAGDFITNINFSSSIPLPKKLGIRIQAKKLSPFVQYEIADALFRGVMTGPMASVVTKLLPDPNAKKMAKTLQAELRRKSLADLLQIEKLPYPYFDFTDVDMFFATPGAIIPGREDTLVGMGMVLAGKMSLNLMGQRIPIAETDNRLTFKDGLKIYGKVEPRNLGPLKLNKAVIDVAANIQALPHFKIKTDAALFGATEKLDIEVSKDKVGFFYDKNLGPVLKMRVDAKTVGEDLFRAKDFVVTASVGTKLDEILVEEVMPRMGIPEVIGKAIQKANPLLITGGSFNGSLTEFVSGKPVVLKLDHKWFGDKVDPAEVEFRPVWNDPISAFPPVPIARALNKSLLYYLAAHPVKLPRVDLGLIKVEGVTLGALTSDPKDPKFRVSGKSQFLGASRAVDVALSENAYVFTMKDKIAGGLWDSELRAWTIGGTAAAPNDLRYYGTLKSDFNTWLKKQVGGTLSKGFKTIGDGYRNAQAELKGAENKVRGINSLIERKRDDARRDLNRIRNLIRAASKALDHADWLFRKARDSFNWLHDKRRSIERRGWFPFKGAVVWGAKKAEWAAERVLRGARHARNLAQDALNKIADANVPLDLHPLVAPLIVARDIAVGALRAAQITFAGAEGLNNAFKDVTNKLVNAVAGAKVLVVKKAVFTGSVKEAWTDVHLNADIMNSPDHFMRLKVNLLKPWETDLRDLAVTINSIIKGERVQAARGSLPEPPNLPIATVSKKEIQAAILAAAQAEIERRKANDAKARQREQQLAAASQAQVSNTLIIGHQGRCIDFSEGTKNKRGARKAQMWDCHGGKNQRFSLAANGELRADGLCLDNQEDNWLWGYKCTGHEGMRYRILADGRIQNIRSGLCVDLWGVQSGNGKPLRLGGCHNGANQKWTFAKEAPGTFSNSVIVGHQGLCVDFSKGTKNKRGARKAQMYECAGGSNQRFSLAADGRIQADGLCLDPQEETWLWGYKCSDHPGMRFRRLTDGRIQHVSSGLCVDLWGVESGNGKPLRLGGCHGGPNQKWKVTTTVPEPPSRLARAFSGAQLVNVRGQCADENSGKLKKGGKVILWGCNGSGEARERQLWSHNDDGQIKTTNGLCLDVENPNVRRGIPIIIWGCNNSGASKERQRWRVLRDTRIQHVQSGLCLDATNNGNQRGQLVLSTCSTTSTQKWSPRGASS